MVVTIMMSLMVEMMVVRVIMVIVFDNNYKD